jgi:glutathione synthase/RimK-type ligase-like ATP-grasp enzyme
MILVVTQQADVSADLVIDRMEQSGASFARLNCERLLSDVAMTAAEPEGDAFFVDEAGARIDLRSVRAVWYRNPAVPTVTGELSAPHAHFAQREAWALALGALMSLDAKWMSKPAAIWRANQKLFQLSEARRAGLIIPRTIVTRSPEAAWSFISSIPGPVIVKPVTYGTVEGTIPERAIYTTRLPRGLRREDLEPLLLAPVIIQEEIPKRRDVRVTVIGSTLFAVGIESQRNAETATDWRRPLAVHLEHVRMDLPTRLREALCDFVQRLELDFGAIDLVETDSGEFCFLEINPNGQWGWLQLETGIDLSGAIASRLIQLASR